MKTFLRLKIHQIHSKQKKTQKKKNNLKYIPFKKFNREIQKNYRHLINQIQIVRFQSDFNLLCLTVQFKKKKVIKNQALFSILYDRTHFVYKNNINAKKSTILYSKYTKMKRHTALLVLFSIFLLFGKDSLVEASTCCSSCPQNLLIPNQFTPNKVKSIAVGAVSKKQSVTTFFQNFQYQPTVYYKKFLSALKSIDNSSKLNLFYCGGPAQGDYPFEYYPPEVINSIYTSMIDVFNSNPSNRNIQYTQTMVTLLTSLLNQFNNSYGIRPDQFEFNTFISYSSDPSNFTVGSASSSAASHVLSDYFYAAATPQEFILFNQTLFNRLSNHYSDNDVIVLPLNPNLPSGEDTQLTFGWESMLMNSQKSQLGKIKNFLSPQLGDPYGDTVVISLKNVQIDYISSSVRLLSEDLSVKAMVSGDDLTMAQVTAGIFAPYMYCYYPDIIPKFETACVMTCNSGC